MQCDQLTASHQQGVHKHHVKIQRRQCCIHLPVLVSHASLQAGADVGVGSHVHGLLLAPHKLGIGVAPQLPLHQVKGEGHQLQHNKAPISCPTTGGLECYDPEAVHMGSVGQRLGITPMLQYMAGGRGGGWRKGWFTSEEGQKGVFWSAWKAKTVIART